MLLHHRLVSRSIAAVLAAVLIATPALAFAEPRHGATDTPPATDHRDPTPTPPPATEARLRSPTPAPDTKTATPSTPEQAVLGDPRARSRPRSRRSATSSRSARPASTRCRRSWTSWTRELEIATEQYNAAERQAHRDEEAARGHARRTSRTRRPPTSSRSQLLEERIRVMYRGGDARHDRRCCSRASRSRTSSQRIKFLQHGRREGRDARRDARQPARRHPAGAASTSRTPSCRPSSSSSSSRPAASRSSSASRSASRCSPTAQADLLAAARPAVLRSARPSRPRCCKQILSGASQARHHRRARLARSRPRSPTTASRTSGAAPTPVGLRLLRPRAVRLRAARRDAAALLGLAVPARRAGRCRPTSSRATSSSSARPIHHVGHVHRRRLLHPRAAHRRLREGLAARGPQRLRRRPPLPVGHRASAPIMAAPSPAVQPEQPAAQPLASAAATRGYTRPRGGDRP